MGIVDSERDVIRIAIQIRPRSDHARLELEWSDHDRLRFVDKNFQNTYEWIYMKFDFFLIFFWFFFQYSRKMIFNWILKWYNFSIWKRISINRESLNCTVHWQSFFNSWLDWTVLETWRELHIVYLIRSDQEIPTRNFNVDCNVVQVGAFTLPWKMLWAGTLHPRIPV